MTAAEFTEILRSEFPGVTDVQQEQFRAMEAYYREWNAQINVISRKDIDHLYDRHVLHSLAIAKYPGLPAGFAAGSILDFGTGGGFPGIPLAILFPEARFTLCDSVGKKVKVAEAVAKGLGLTRAETVQARGETLRGPFDFVVARAVAPLPELYRQVKGMYDRGLICLKGGDIAEEIAELTLRFRLPKGSVRIWRIDSWLSDPYYHEKFVLFIQKR